MQNKISYSAPRVDTSYFKEYGYLLMKGVFSAEEMQERRASLEATKDRLIGEGKFQTLVDFPKAHFLLGDVLAFHEIRAHDFVLFDPRIVESVKQLLGPKLVYWGDSNVQTGEGIRGFHKDNVDRYDATAPDWQSDYTIVRCGIYFQDHSRHSGGLKVRQKSHNYATHKKGKMVNIPSEVGDVLIWNLRTTHSGNNVRVRGMTGVCLHPRIEMKTPYALRAPEQLNRISMFGSFGTPSNHTDRYIANMVNRSDYDPYFRNAAYNSELVSMAAARNIEIRRPVDFYGVDYTG